MLGKILYWTWPPTLLPNLHLHRTHPKAKLDLEHGKITDDYLWMIPFLMWPNVHYLMFYRGILKCLQAHKSWSSKIINKLDIFQYMGKIFCVEVLRVALKFHTKYLSHFFSIVSIFVITTFIQELIIQG